MKDANTGCVLSPVCVKMRLWPVICPGLAGGAILAALPQTL